MLNNIPCKVCNDRDDHRPAAAELAPDPSAQRTAHLLLELVSVFCPGKHRILKVQHDLGTDFIKFAFILSDSIQIDLRPADDLIPVSVYYNETGNKAFLAQDAALFQLIFCDLADRSTIDIDVSAGDTANDSSLSMVQVNDITVLGKNDILGIHTGLDSYQAIGNKMPVLSVDRHCAFRLDDIVEIQELAFIAVP